MDLDKRQNNEIYTNIYNPFMIVYCFNCNYIVTNLILKSDNILLRQFINIIK